MDCDGAIHRVYHYLDGELTVWIRKADAAGWHFPTSGRKAGETILEVAKRELWDSARIVPPRLDLLGAIRQGRLRDHLSIARLLKDGSLIEHERVQHLTTRAVKVVTDVDLPVNLDGEIATTSPVLVEVVRNAIDVVVPDHVTHVRQDAGSRAAR